MLILATFFDSFGFVLLLYSVRYDCCVCNWSNWVCKYIHTNVLYVFCICFACIHVAIDVSIVAIVAAVVVQATLCC